MDDDITPSSKPKMKKEKLGYSVSSKQKRLGPAPLASFEDLPTDEQLSPDSERYIPCELELDSEAYESILNQKCRQMLDQPKNTSNADNDDCSSGSITPTNILPANNCPFNQHYRQNNGQGTLSSPTNGNQSRSKSDFLSQFSLTDKSMSNFLTPGYSGGDKTPTPGQGSRKNSWTDILFFRNRSRSKSSITDSDSKSPTLGAKYDEKDSSSKNKKGFFSFFRFSRKSSSASQADSVMPSHEHVANLDSDCADSSIPRFSVDDTNGNNPCISEEIVIHKDLDDEKEKFQQKLALTPDGLSENSLELKDNVQTICSNCPNYTNNNINNNNNIIPLSIPSPVRPNVLRKLKKRTETIDDDCLSLPEKLPSSCKSTEFTENPDSSKSATPTNKDDEISSGSDADNDSTATLFAEPKDKQSENVFSADEIECATLLTQDSVDNEDSSICESITMKPPKYLDFNNTNNSQLKLTSKKDRLDINTVPVDRPRSTTPINVASIEAFIKSATSGPDNGVEKIKLLLPSDVFSCTVRPKSPRPVNPQIWLDFCEKGLQSPKTRRQKEKNSEKLTNSHLDFDDAFTPITNSPSTAVTPLTPISPPEPNNEWTPFGDDFGSMKIQDCAELNKLLTNLSVKCSHCNCQNVNDNLISKDETSVQELDDATNTDENDDQVSEGCDCGCHFNNNYDLTAGTNNNNETGTMPDLFYNSKNSVSSNISSASSRLIQASSSSIDDIEDKVSP